MAASAPPEEKAQASGRAPARRAIEYPTTLLWPFGRFALMAKFRIAVHITPRKGLLDPQGNAVRDALRTLGFNTVKDVHVGRYIVVETDAYDAIAAEEAVTEMCQKLLANPVTEDFDIESAVHA
jgi:phosphoribosylformylglycinamidine synthase PurS subunit